MTTTFSIQEMIEYYENVLNVCNKRIEHLTHPEIYGCCLCNCNSIVINKERLMVITTDENHMTKHCFSPLYPTFFSPKTAKKIVEEDIYKDINDNRIKLEIIGELEYYKLLKDYANENIENCKKFEHLCK